MLNFLNTTPDGGIIIKQPDALHDNMYSTIAFLLIATAFITFMVFITLIENEDSSDEAKSAKRKSWTNILLSTAIVSTLICIGTIIHWNVNTGVDKMVELNSVNIKEWADARYDINLGDKAVENLLDGDDIETKDNGSVQLNQAEDDGYYLMFVNQNDEEAEVKELPVKNN